MYLYGLAHEIEMPSITSTVMDSRIAAPHTGAMHTSSDPAIPAHKRLQAGEIVLTLGGVFVTTYDSFATNVALRAIGQALNATGAELQWIVAAYGLCFGGALLVGSRMAEIWGAKRAFKGGMLAFAGSTLCAALAPDALTLIAARTLQGFSAATLMPQVMTLLARISNNAMRQQAFAGYGVALGLGPAVGQLAAGLTVEYGPQDHGWRFIFLANSLIALVIALIYRPSREEKNQTRLDWLGVTGLILSIACILFPVIEGRRMGWPIWLIGPVAVGALGIRWVLGRQNTMMRTEFVPLVDLEALRRRGYAWALATVLTFYTTNASFYLVLSLTLSAHFKLNYLEIAGIFTALVAAFLVPTLMSRQIQARFGFKALVMGSSILAVMHGLLSFQFATAASLTSIMPALLMACFAIGVLMAPMLAAALEAGGSSSGASGLTGSAQWIGNAVGIAVAGTIYFESAGDSLMQASQGQAVAHGMFALLTCGVVLMLRIWRRYRH